MSVLLSQVDIGDSLGEGGQAQVFRVNGHPELALKIYHAAVLPGLRTQVLRNLVAELGNLSLEGRPITYWATWPVDTVVNHSGHVVGFLMPVIGADFFMSEGNLAGRPADFRYLAAEPAPKWGDVSLPDVGTRLRLLAQLAGILQQLHHRRMVVGDLSSFNAVWSTRPEPRVMLVDCDGIRPPIGPPVADGFETPDWMDPEAVPNASADVDRDCYKFALMVLRVLTRKVSVRPRASGDHSLVGLNDRMAESIDELLRRAAGAPGTRPSATEWRFALQGRPVRRVKTRPATTPFIWPHGGGEPVLTEPGVRRWQQVAPPPRPSIDHVDSPLEAPAAFQDTRRVWKPIEPPTRYP
ncbi:MAG: hypothetical protein QM619_11105 [Micropruina sp.]|uniref:hypothetical protein n=1 Tax=Micropruina sp. TaxID=2737536 RepID=UPI0039E59B47